jgi:hypothetical protein
MDGQYPALRVVAAALKIMGVLLGLASLGCISYILLNLDKQGIAAGLLIWFGLILAGVLIFALGNLVDLLMDIERNTRDSAFFARRNADDDAQQMRL